jgi:hypothetical protein
MATTPNVIVPKIDGVDQREILVVATLPDGQLNTDGEIIYSKTTGLVLSSKDFFPTHEMVGFILSAGTGNIPIKLHAGEIVLTYTVDVGYIEVELKGFLIQQILSSGYTYSGHIFPLF